MWLCLQNKSSHQVPESCGHLPTIGIPKAIYHYMTNTTKQQPTYQLFQNIMRPKNQLVNPQRWQNSLQSVLSPSFCCKSAATSDLWSWVNGPIRVDLGVTWPAKWRGMYPSWPPGGAGADIGMLEGLAHFYVMQNTDNLYFPRAIQWIKNTFIVIL